VVRTLLILLTGLLSPAITALSEEAKYPDPSRYQGSIDAFLEAEKENPISLNAVVVTGSSSMRIWHATIEKDLSPLPVIPRGFGGSNMNDVFFYLNELVVKHRPAKVLLYEGDNDVALGATPQQIMQLLNQILIRIQSELPNTKVYLLYVKPSPLRWSLWPVMQDVNKRYQSLCDTEAYIECIDIASPMLDESGNPKTEIFLMDNLHMNDKGYRLWTQAVRSVLLPGRPDPTKVVQ